MGIISNTRFRPGSPQNERFARLSVVVGDSQDFFLHQTRRTLAQLGVRDMHLARDGAEALGIVRTQEPHLAIVDWDLKAIPGSPAPNLPIIMTMASVDRMKISRAMNAGVNEILIKPVTADALLRRIISAIAAQRGKPQVTAGNYIGPDRRQVSEPITEERRAGT